MFYLIFFETKVSCSCLDIANVEEDHSQDGLLSDAVKAIVSPDDVEEWCADDDVKGGGGNDLEDRFSGEEGPRGTDELGLEKGRAGE